MTSREWPRPGCQDRLRLAWALLMLICVGMMIGLTLFELGRLGYGFAYQVWGP